MHAQIEILASLQTVDREIKEQTGLKQGLLTELQAKEKEIQTKKREISLLTAACAEKEKLRLEKDRVPQDEGRKATDKRMRMNRIKNIKELQALQREIEQMRESNGDLEEELIKIMQDIDALKAQMQTKESEMAAMRDYYVAQLERYAGDREAAVQLLSVGVTPVDRSVDPVQLAALTNLTTVVMNTPDAYSLR